MAAMRVKQLKRIPYFLGTDMNVNPKSSPQTQACIKAGIWHDIFDDAMIGEPPPTFARGGVHADMEGTGITRIDTVLVNPAAADTIHRIYDDYIEGASFDHVPLHLLLNVSAFHDEADTLVQPTRIIVRTLTGMTTKQRLETLRREAKIF